jgi:hypothetical protein
MRNAFSELRSSTASKENLMPYSVFVGAAPRPAIAGSREKPYFMGFLQGWPDRPPVVQVPAIARTRA